MEIPVDLTGVSVLVTRPAQQAGPLRRLIEARGGSALMLPAIEIKPHPERRTILAQVGTAQRFDLYLFISANAVRFGVEILDHRSDLTLAAIGPATARALNKLGYRISIVPEHGFDSESLLAHPRLAQLHDRRVLLIKGKGGRDTLAQELSARGAEVTTAEVYLRATARLSRQKLAALASALSEGAVHVVTITSLELAANLVAALPPAIRASLYGLPWVVPSERVALGVHNLGVHGEIMVAGSAEDHEILDALLRWRSIASGA